VNRNTRVCCFNSLCCELLCVCVKIDFYVIRYTARDVYMHIFECVFVYVCVRAWDLLACFNILRGYTDRIFPEKLCHVPSVPDSPYFNSNDKEKICEARKTWRIDKEKNTYVTSVISFHGMQLIQRE